MAGETIHCLNIGKYKKETKKPDYIQRLLELHQPIDKLLFRGNNPYLLAKLLERPCVAIVGSRHPSPYGEHVTRELTKTLVGAGVVIISGLALGIDSNAHQTAIKEGGYTIAVLPSSLDNIYPRRHYKLATDIIDSGGVLGSEYPEFSPWPKKYQFIARNRIIAALSDIVIITEAGEKSGSLHTANFALELGIEVMAIPGSIASNNSPGTNSLIRQGATPLLDYSDPIKYLQQKDNQW